MECTIGAISLSIIVQIKVQYVKKTHVGFMKSFNLKLNAPMVILSSTYASNDQIWDGTIASYLANNLSSQCNVHSTHNNLLLP